ncbi:hypothetical protein BDQ17DRAFT_1328224 [Cyathus striatus]|nr:hypothetical protein BDQ17DRAFT_1328224 [Cyathus striatus]
MSRSAHRVRVREGYTKQWQNVYAYSLGRKGGLSGLLGWGMEGVCLLGMRRYVWSGRGKAKKDEPYATQQHPNSPPKLTFPLPRFPTPHLIRRNTLNKQRQSLHVPLFITAQRIIGCFLHKTETEREEERKGNWLPTPRYTVVWLEMLGWRLDCQFRHQHHIDVHNEKKGGGGEKRGEEEKGEEEKEEEKRRRGEEEKRRRGEEERKGVPQTPASCTPILLPFAYPNTLSKGTHLSRSSAHYSRPKRRNFPAPPRRTSFARSEGGVQDVNKLRWVVVRVKEAKRCSMYVRIECLVFGGVEECA